MQPDPQIQRIARDTRLISNYQVRVPAVVFLLAMAGIVGFAMIIVFFGVLGAIFSPAPLNHP